MEWDTYHRWRQQIERRLNEVCSMARGNQAFQSDRILDLVEQIEELKVEIKEMKETVENARKAYSDLRDTINEKTK